MFKFICMFPAKITHTYSFQALLTLQTFQLHKDMYKATPQTWTPQMKYILPLKKRTP